MTPKRTKRTNLRDVPYRQRWRVVDKLYTQLQRLADQVCGKDDVGDSNVEIIVIDRTRYERMHYGPVLYRHYNVTNVDGEFTPRELDDLDEQRLRTIWANASAGNSGLDNEITHIISEKHKK